jgi:hypothetical protein
MKPSLLVAATLSAALAASGCYRTVVHTGKPRSGIVVSKWSHTFIGGLIGSEHRAPCEPAVVETRLGIMGLLISIVTANIWVPLTVEVECAAGSEPPRTHGW